MQQKDQLERLKNDQIHQAEFHHQQIKEHEEAIQRHKQFLDNLHKWSNIAEKWADNLIKWLKKQKKKTELNSRLYNDYYETLHNCISISYTYILYCS